MVPTLVCGGTTPFSVLLTRDGIGRTHFLFGPETTKVGSGTDKWDPVISFFLFFPFSFSYPFSSSPTAWLVQGTKHAHLVSSAGASFHRKAAPRLLFSEPASLLVPSPRRPPHVSSSASPPRSSFPSEPGRHSSCRACSRRRGSPARWI